MARNVTIVTPENITVTYQVAGFASRFLATVIDLLIQVLLVLGISFVIRFIASGFALVGLNISDFTTGIAYILYFVVWWVYASLFEMFWGGRTPGKRMLGLRVIRDGGYPINLISSAIRNVLRFLDFGIIPLGAPMLLFGLPGMISIFLSPQYKRLGDWAAGTIVIVEVPATPFAGARERDELSPEATGMIPYVKNLDRITPEEYRVIRRYTERRAGWTIPVQAALGERLARPLLQKLDMSIDVSYQLQYASWLEVIERLYTEENSLL